MIRKQLLFITILILPWLALFSQEIEYDNLPVYDYSNIKEYEIAEITVSGVKFLQPAVLISISGFKVGNRITIPGDDITKAVNKFWDQGLFADVKITARKIEDGKIYLDIYLKEQPRLSRLIVDGLKKGETEDLMENLNVRTGSQVTTDLLNNTERLIKDHFIEKGFFDTRVAITQVPDTLRPNSVRLFVKVDKGPRIKIEDVIFEGNEVFPEKRLRRVLKNTKKVNINIFKASKYIKDQYKEDKQSLITFYNENGYRDAKILGDSMVRVEDENRLILKIFLVEGRKYFFRNVNWVGNTIYPSHILGAVLGIERGDVFDQTLLSKRLEVDEDAVSSLYLDHGYLFFSVDPVEIKVEGDSIDFEMRIYEGKQARINEVIISGNTKTNEHVVRREIRTKPGELFSKSDIIRTVRELAQLGHFDPEKIEPIPIPNPTDGTVDIEYKLVERANDQLEISGGWGAGMLVGTLGLRFSNFAVKDVFKPKAWRPIPAGDGQTLSLRAQSNGKYYRSYNITFMEPWFGGKKPNSLSVSFFHTLTNNSLYFWDAGSSSMKITGASLGLGRRLRWPDDFFTLYNELSFQQYNLDNWTGYFTFSNGKSNNFSFTTTVARKSIDQLIYPRRGSTFSLSLQLTPPYSAFNNKDYTQVSEQERYNWIEYHKWKFLADWYTTLAGNLVFYTRAHFGYLGHYNDDLGPSPFEGFDVGGDGMSGFNIYGYEVIALRGYENGSLTPRVNGLKSGNVYTRLTLELRYPITLNPSATVFVLTFLEAGNAWYSIDDFNPFLAKRSAGVGLRAFLPMFGLLGIDWGYGFDPIPGLPDAGGSQFHFTIGQQF
ncbi:MAG: outer membrane protein assembly factor BamA [Bacteroidales bacterium]|nr:outer membrane protein assembly factor BamA [Bacteroidales bacterium]